MDDLYAMVRELRGTNGSGVIVVIEWFDRDPGNDRDLQPILHDQVLIPAPDVASVTTEQLDAALVRREEELIAERAVAAASAPNAAVAEMVGHARRMRGGRSERPRR